MVNMITVNFEGVESGGLPSVKVPEGDYALVIKSVKKRVGKESKADYLLFGLKITDGNPKGIGKTIPHTCSLSKASLWNLRNLLEAAGKTISGKALKIDLDKLVGLTLAASLIDGEFEGKAKSVVGAFFPMSEFTPPAKVATPANGSAAPEAEDEAEGEAEGDESEDDDSEDLFNE